MKIKYRKYKNEDKKNVIKLIKRFYTEDPTPKGMSNEKIKKTLAFLPKHKERGIILVFDYNKEIIGYSVLINFWSNEYGGNIIYIDELFVKKEWRRKGIATEFITALIKKRINNAIAIQLEVTPNNKNARKLYERLGFIEHKNPQLTKEM